MGGILNALADGADYTATEFTRDQDLNAEEQRLVKDYKAVAKSLRTLVNRLDLETDWGPNFGGSGEE